MRCVVHAHRARPASVCKRILRSAIENQRKAERGTPYQLQLLRRELTDMRDRHRLVATLRATGLGLGSTRDAGAAVAPPVAGKPACSASATTDAAEKWGMRRNSNSAVAAAEVTAMRMEEAPVEQFTC